MQVPRGYARAAEALGASVLAHTEVTGIVLEGGKVDRVLTTAGEIRCNAVVDAAGAWSRLVAGDAGQALGLVPTRHQLMITEPIEGVRPEQPIARVIDCNVYIRPDKGGLMLGGYEPDPMQMDMAAAGRRFTIADLALDIGVLQRLAARVREQFPIFQDSDDPHPRASRRPADDDAGRDVCRRPDPGGCGDVCRQRLLRRRPDDLAGAGRGAGVVDHHRGAVGRRGTADAGAGRAAPWVGAAAGAALPGALRAPLLVGGVAARTPGGRAMIPGGEKHDHPG